MTGWNLALSRALACVVTILAGKGPCRMWVLRGRAAASWDGPAARRWCGQVAATGAAPARAGGSPPAQPAANRVADHLDAVPLAALLREDPPMVTDFLEPDQRIADPWRDGVKFIRLVAEEFVSPLPPEG
jgi:hypothetical protein